MPDNDASQADATAATGAQAPTTATAAGNAAAGGNQSQQPPVRLPDDHPLVKAYATVKSDRDAARTKVKEFEDADKDELTRLTEDRDSHKTRADTAELELARYKAGVAAGVDPQWYGRIQGATPEEMAADAAALAKTAPANGRPAPVTTQGTDGGGDGTQQQTADDWLRNQARK